MLDSKKLEYYFCLQASYGNYSLVPKEAKNIKVLDVKRLSGGLTNNVYSFMLKFNQGDSEKSLNLVLKGYTNEVGLWFNNYHSDEEVRPYVREYDTLKALEHIGFPASQACFCEHDSFFLGYPFLIMSQESVAKNSITNLDIFTTTLAALHNLEPDKLDIKSLRFPEDSFEFARDQIACLEHFVKETKHYRFLRKDFNYAIDWLESNVADNGCPKFSLIHGEYHPGHTLFSNSNKLTVIDWESVMIGDPAFDVGYSYHMIKLMYNEETAENFLSDYAKHFRGDVRPRLAFYKLVALLGVAVEVSSVILNPLNTYKYFGNRALARALVFPFARSISLSKKWLNENFFMLYLQYCQEFIETTLRR